MCLTKLAKETMTIKEAARTSLSGTIRIAILFLFFQGMLCSSVVADVRLPALVSDGMVLQRGVDLKIWGWASPNERVAMQFAGKSYRAVAGRDGKWLVVLPPMDAGGPYTMDIQGDNQVTVRDILIGDVWFCSGQSNMVLPMERIKEKYPDAIASAAYPQIRNFFVPTAADVRKVQDDLPPGKWVTTTPEHVLPMGGATFFFARQLYERYRVPIGIINASVGGTPAQAWVSADGLGNLEPYAAHIAALQDTAYYRVLTMPDEVPSQPKPFPVDKGTTGPVAWFDPAYEPQGWRPFWMPGYWDDQGTRNLHGVLWFRKEVDIPPAMAGRPAKLFLGRIVDADETYVNGIKVGNITYQYPPRRYEIPEGVLKGGKNLIVVRVTNTAGKGGFVPDKNYSLTDGEHTIDLRGDWMYQIGMVQPPTLDGSTARAPVFSAQNEPTGLYNTMVAPAADYAIKGFLWYQGEANTHRPDDYGSLMKALIADWRNKWGLGALPFIYVQLPNFMEVDFSPTESNWALLREQQLQTLSVPHTAMAVAIDLGEWNDIHPLNKKDVGERLALAAEKLAYGDTGVVHSGPIVESVEVKGNQIIVSFDQVGSGLVAKDGGDLCHFAIAGADKHFVWANARIERNTVVIWNDDIDKPLYVRYGWADNPECANLYNKEGLPASPFRTDQP
ncbi:sialate O-acetylesterase [Parapedobacter koreensis]|uniref:Sialate O-acetylesterase n=1 Tax=Parapedobacter koreensis TaxID=332977 RepID=A0A1H7JS53_9SPHI|nr:sialate O-acetylesterase [Parapedobacter koreensis]SEK77166.1 sialate O-acetylesterase [Parapedobacter koreensis]